MSEIGIGVVGLGNVGSGALRVLHDNASSISNRLGFPLVVRSVCSRGVFDSPPEAVSLYPDAERTIDWRDVVANPRVQIVAELVGGTSVAAELIEAAIAAGKSVVTANKELIAVQGADIARQCESEGVQLGLEASVAGGIPILNSLREGIAGDQPQALMGILNGTSNFILTEIERRGDSLESILKEAQDLGYAEADPTADVDGLDARSKLAILAALAFGVEVSPDEIPVAGIRRITPVDFAYADRLGHTLRLVASARSRPDGLQLRVGPALVRKDTIFAKVLGSYNAVWVRGSHGEDTFYYGRGAGPEPTGVAVVSDIMAVARDLTSGAVRRVSPLAHTTLERYSPAESGAEQRQFYLRFRVRDRPGIIAKLGAILADHGVSIDAVLQEPQFDKQNLPFVITVETTTRRSIEAAVAAMEDLDFLVDKPLALPLEEGLADR